MRPRLLALALAFSLPAAAQSVPASVEALQTLVVKAQVGGQVARVACDVGDAVKGLDLLAVIGNPGLTAELGVLDLELACRQHELDSLAEAAKIATIHRKLAERAVKSAGSELPLAQQRSELAQRLATDLDTLYAAGRSTNTEMQQAKLAATAAAAEARAAERRTLDAQDQLAIADAELQQATLAVQAQRTRLDAARAKRDGVDVRMRQCEVKCVLATAKVSRVFVGKGDVVAPGDRLLELVDVSRLRVVLRLPPALAARAPVGTKVRVFAVGADDLVPGATITRLGAAVEGDQCLPAIVEIPATAGLFPGMELRAELLPPDRK